MAEDHDQTPSQTTDRGTSSVRVEDTHQVVLTTCPDMDTGERIAIALVNKRLAACVNVLPAMRSIYRWKGEIESAQEHLLVIKGRTHDFEAIQACIQSLHPYELPEVIAVPIVGGLPAYLSWLNNPE